jgi:peptidoglycan hydrolase CwlO-like protein
MCSPHDPQGTSIPQQRRHTIRSVVLGASPQKTPIYEEEYVEADKFDERDDIEHAAADVNRLGIQVQRLRNEIDDIVKEIAAIRMLKITKTLQAKIDGLQARLPKLREDLAEMKIAHQEAMLDWKSRTLAQRKVPPEDSWGRGLHKKR